MYIFPAIDLIDKKAVRLLKGDYGKKTVFNENPVAVALDFKSKGAEYIHIVDLDGAKSGLTPNFDTVKAIKEESGLFCEIGGGIRNTETAEKYLNAGIDRVILGTAALTDPVFLENAIKNFGDKIAVGVDIKDGKVAIKGWTEKSEKDAFEFCRELEEKGVSTVICTDISKDGAMEGTNFELYEKLKNELKMNITASGGVTDINDIKKLRELELYAAIIGKAYYTGSIDLKQAIEVAV